MNIKGSSRVADLRFNVNLEPFVSFKLDDFVGFGIWFEYCIGGGVPWLLLHG